ncbi:MAG: DNA repair protein RadC [Patescibacteria group bacterium]|nr:DNA repair protein RadC [Patescibacteria group bacterium]MDE1940552.1 DNA repair protein RadC [Patescibacteria group bacterium]MDE1967117.1 DNA repair protein RadC [Patescibacteria group bacterium]
MAASYSIESPYYLSSASKLTYNGKSFSGYRGILKETPASERPREKLLAHGPEALSTRELAILLLITGTSKESVVEMTERIVKAYGEKSIFEERDPAKLSEDLGIPIAKACQIVAVGEIGRRTFDKSKTASPTIKSAKDVYEYLADMRNLPKEHLRALYLNVHGRILKDQVLSIGTVDSHMITPRDVFNPAIDLMAVAVILAHNHPGGELAPSEADVKMTEQLVQAGKILGIPILDHVIIAKDGFTSIKANY